MPPLEIDRRPGQAIYLYDRAGRQTVIEVANVELIGDRVRLVLRGPWIQRAVLVGGPMEPGAPEREIVLESSRH